MARVHATSVVDPAADLGPNVDIGPYTVIEGPVRIGEGTRIIGQAHITGHTEIGPECTIHPFATIGGHPQDKAFTGERSYCRVGARNVIREGVTIHRGTAPESVTRVGDDCMLMAYSHVAHNCTVEDHVILINAVLIAGHCTVGHHAVLGGQVAVHQFCRIGEYAMVGGGTLVTQDAMPFMCHVDRNVCIGINRVGLRRNGFSKEAIDELRWLHRRLLRSGAIMGTTARELTAEVQTDAGRRLLEFVLASSRRGIGGRSTAPTRGAASEPVPEPGL